MLSREPGEGKDHQRRMSRPREGHCGARQNKTVRRSSVFISLFISFVVFCLPTDLLPFVFLSKQSQKVTQRVFQYYGSHMAVLNDSR